MAAATGAAPSRHGSGQWRRRKRRAQVHSALGWATLAAVTVWWLRVLLPAGRAFSGPDASGSAAKQSLCRGIDRPPGTAAWLPRSGGSRSVTFGCGFSGDGPASALARAATPSVFSGVGEALVTIFAGELGDKTFFLTMMLSLSRGRLFAMLSSQSALWLMTAFSCAIGVAIRNCPQFASNQLLVNAVAAMLMFFFGAQTLAECATATVEVRCDEGTEIEREECRLELEMSKVKSGGPLSLLRPAVLIFLAEWGDKSMLATVTLAATRSPVGTFIGGCMGHLGAATLAVAGGGLMDKYVGDRALKIFSGCLFISFGVTTLLGVY